MKYGDLASIVQLGVGLHVGTAVLQLYSELGLTPFERRLARIGQLFKLPPDERPKVELKERLSRLEGRYSILKIRFFYRYKKLVIANGCIATVLAVFLIVIAFNADDTICDLCWIFPLAAIAGSFLPAPVILVSLAVDAQRNLKSLRVEATKIEGECLAPTQTDSHLMAR